MEYVVPFLCADKEKKVNRIALGYYIRNLLSADKFDIESAMPTIRDFVKKDKDVLETNVLKVVRFLGKVGSREIRKPTDSVKNPTKWFCKRLAKLMRAIKPTDYFLERLGYAYVQTDICHTWIQAFLDYKGPHKKNLLRYMAYAVNDAMDKPSSSDKKITRIFSNVFDKITTPENLPVPIYLALIECRRTYAVKDWLRFTKTNIDFGRDIEENDRCLKLLVTMMLRRLDSGCFYEEKKSICESLKLLGKTNESDYIAKCLYRRMAGMNSRSAYVEIRQLISDDDFFEFSKTVHKKVDQRISKFVKAYEHPNNEILLMNLSWEEKLMIFEKLDSKKKKEVKNKCISEFDRYLNLPYGKRELFYMFKILSSDRDFINKHLHDERLFSKSMESSRFRIMYLEKMHALDNRYLSGNEKVHTDGLHKPGNNFAIALLPSRDKNGKIKEYRSIVMTVKDRGQSLVCEALTKKPHSKLITYSAVKFNDKGASKALYPGITKRAALLFAEKIFSSVRKDISALA